MKNSWMSRFLLNILAIMFCAWLLPGIEVNGFVGAVIVAVVLGIINAIVKPILIFFTLPITLITLGLFLLVIDSFMILLADAMLDSIWVKSWLWALIFGIVLSIVNSLLHSMVGLDKGD